MKNPLSITLAAPRGFCAGVDRAIQIVEEALRKYGPPIYVRHEIVHNRHVVQELAAKGAIFIEELDEAPEAAKVIFSAHGVPKSVPKEAERRELFYLDATCPLVSKVHREAERLHRDGYHILLIGHAGHPEVVGTMGQLPPGSMTLVQQESDVADVPVPDGKPVAYATQTTLSVDETKDIITALKQRFPEVREPKQEDICYATTNRQQAVKDLAAQVDLFLVVGAPNSSNSMRLVEVARQYGCPQSHLVQTAKDIDWAWFDGVERLGVSAGASAPELLVQQVIEACGQRFDVSVQEQDSQPETVRFKLPRALVAA